MATIKTMANKRLHTIFSHLSPPITLRSSELGHSEELISTSNGNGFEVECQGPNSDREAKLLENLMLSRLRRFYTQEKCIAERISLVPCSGELKSQEIAEEHVDLDLETRALEKFDEETPTQSEEEREWAEPPVRSGITSARAVSSSGGIGGESMIKVNVEKMKKMKTKKKKSKSMNQLNACEFCDIIQGTAPCFKLYEDELCLCILDINPLSVGHSLILPKSHFPCLEATPPQVAAAMCAAVPLISRALLAATRCDSFNMLVNSGVAAGQVVMHTHFHIIPRCKGDGLWKSESASRRPLRKVQEAKLLAQAVRTKLSATGSGSATQQQARTSSS